MIEEAIKMASRVKKLRNSDTKNYGTKIAALSDLMVRKTLGGKIVSDQSYDYDWISPKGSLVEIKSKQRNIEPQPWHHCSVKAYNTNQKCDYYLFTSVFGDFTRGWILGYIKKKDFFEHAQFFKGGEFDPDPRGDRYKFPSDCYNIRIDQLNCKFSSIYEKNLQERV